MVDIKLLKKKKKNNFGDELEIDGEHSKGKPLMGYLYPK